MPLSLLTRLRGVTIVAVFAIALLWLEISDQMWAWATGFLLMPLLIWLLVSNAIKDAPPFDDTAFHRTRPVTAGQVYRHLVGFHLLLLGCILLVVLAYVWRFNLGVREAIFGTIAMMIPLIAIGSLFGTMASLWTSPAHWKGWPFFLLLLIPAISLFAFIASFLRQPQEISFASLTFAGCIIYPALWWLVAVRRRWFLGNALGLFVGIAMPWISLPVALPQEWLWQPPPQHTPHQIKRLKSPATPEGMVDGQTPVSRLLQVRGLAPDEFIQVTRMTSQKNPYGHGDVLNDLAESNFCTDKEGRLIPAAASLFRVMGYGSTDLPWWDNSPDEAWHRTIEDHMRLPIRRYANDKRRPQVPSAEVEAHGWRVQGLSYRWVKVLDVPAVDGGRTKLPGKGTIRVLPLEETSGDFSLTLRVIKAELIPWSSGTSGSPISPVVIAKSSDGKARFIELQGPGASQHGFLAAETEYEFRDQTHQARGDERLKVLRDSRVEVYWADLQGLFSANLPPPE
jgi:hypothetical protein